VLSTSVSGDGANVGVESRVGFRVMTRVTGELVPSAALTRASGSYRLGQHVAQPAAARIVEADAGQAREEGRRSASQRGNGSYGQLATGLRASSEVLTQWGE